MIDYSLLGGSITEWMDGSILSLGVFLKEDALHSDNMVTNHVMHLYAIYLLKHDINILKAVREPQFICSGLSC